MGLLVYESRIMTGLGKEDSKTRVSASFTKITGLERQRQLQIAVTDKK